MLNSCVAFDNFLPRGCFSLVKNYPQGLPLKFQYTTFGSIKVSGNEIFTGSLTGSEPEMTTYQYLNRSPIFRHELFLISMSHEVDLYSNLGLYQGNFYQQCSETFRSVLD